MLLRTALRCGPAGWAALVLIPALLFLAGEDVSDQHIWESAGAGAVTQLGFITTVCGGCAAWEGARVRRGRVLEWAPVRGGLRIALDRLWPTLLLGLLAEIVVQARFTAPAWDSPGSPDPGLITVWLVAVAAHTATGYVVGFRLPRSAGVAVMLVGGFFWGFWPAALGEPSWLRHLNGQGELDCCTIDQELSVRSTAATLTFYTGVILAIAVSAVFRDRILHRVVTAVVLVAGLGVSVLLAVPLGFEGSQPRDKALRHCADSGICLWPEQEPERAGLERTVDRVRARLKPVGVTLPRHLTFSDIRPGQEALLEETATSVLPEDVVPCEEGDDMQGRREDSHTVLYVWLSLTAGTGAGTFTDRMPEEAVDLAEKVRSLPPASQKDWYEQNVRATRDCRTKPQPVPRTRTANNHGSGEGS